jgi:hypothetical protein
MVNAQQDRAATDQAQRGDEAGQVWQAKVRLERGGEQPTTGGEIEEDRYDRQRQQPQRQAQPFALLSLEDGGRDKQPGHAGREQTRRWVKLA